MAASQIILLSIIEAECCLSIYIYSFGLTSIYLELIQQQSRAAEFELC